MEGRALESSPAPTKVALEGDFGYAPGVSGKSPLIVGGPFDALALLAAQVCFVPAALVLLDSPGGLRLEGQSGLNETELAAALALGQRTLAAGDWLELREPAEGMGAGLRWFTGWPIRTGLGVRLAPQTDTGSSRERRSMTMEWSRRRVGPRRLPRCGRSRTSSS